MLDSALQELAWYPVTVTDECAAGGFLDSIGEAYQGDLTLMPSTQHPGKTVFTYQVGMRPHLAPQSVYAPSSSSGLADGGVPVHVCPARTMRVSGCARDVLHQTSMLSQRSRRLCLIPLFKHPGEILSHLLGGCAGNSNCKGCQGYRKL